MNMLKLAWFLFQNNNKAILETCTIPGRNVNWIWENCKSEIYLVYSKVHDFIWKILGFYRIQINRVGLLQHRKKKQKKLKLFATTQTTTKQKKIKNNTTRHDICVNLQKMVQYDKKIILLLSLNVLILLGFAIVSLVTTVKMDTGCGEPFPNDNFNLSWYQYLLASGITYIIMSVYFGIFAILFGCKVEFRRSPSNVFMVTMCFIVFYLFIWAFVGYFSLLNYMTFYTSKAFYDNADNCIPISGEIFWVPTLTALCDLIISLSIIGILRSSRYEEESRLLQETRNDITSTLV